MDIRQLMLRLEDLRQARVLVKSTFVQYAAMLGGESGWCFEILEGLQLQKELIDHKLKVLWGQFHMAIPQPITTEELRAAGLPEDWCDQYRKEDHDDNEDLEPPPM